MQANADQLGEMGVSGLSETGPPELPGRPVPGLPDDSGGDEDSADEAWTPEELEALLGAEPAAASDAGPIRTGSRRTGRVVAVDEAGVIVSFGAKVEGIVPVGEFRGADGEVSVEPGEAVEVVVERLGAPGAYAVLSHRRVREAAAWKRIEAARAENQPMQAKVIERIKGGLRVDIGVPAFLPASQVDAQPVRDLDAWVGRTIEVAVMECNRRRANAVVSRSALLKAALQERRAETLARLTVGEAASGVVKNITDYGVFVDLGGIDGLIKLAELSHGRVRKPGDVLKPGEEVTAKVLRVDPAKDRALLSLRQMQPDPWATIAETCQPGSRVRGRVTSVRDYGAFVEVARGIEGLIHITEIDWSRRVKHPSKTFSEGAEIEAVVLGVSPEERRISLSYKRLTPDPWDEYGGSLQPGQVVAGVVRQIAAYGVFVEIAEGIEGLVHVSDLSWDARAKNPRDLARKGQQLNTVILQVDTENRRLSLGVKQLAPDVWEAFLSENAVGDVMDGLVLRSARHGAFVELAPGVEGFCRNSQAPRAKAKGKPALKAGQRYRFQILDVNERGRKISLRCEGESPDSGDEPPPE